MKPRVLIVDDEPLMLNCLEAVLQSDNFDVQTARSAATAIAALESSEFDLVLTDMTMETEMAGYDVAQAAQRQSYRPAVVILTALQIPPSEWKRRGVKELFTKGQATPTTLSRAMKTIFDELRCRRAPLPMPQLSASPGSMLR